MQDHNKKQEQEQIKEDADSDPVICQYCNIPKTGFWYCYICGFPYNNDDCDD
jgi:hypothetical protein